MIVTSMKMFRQADCFLPTEQTGMYYMIQTLLFVNIYEHDVINNQNIFKSHKTGWIF